MVTSGEAANPQLAEGDGYTAARIAQIDALTSRAETAEALLQQARELLENPKLRDAEKFVALRAVLDAIQPGDSHVPT